MKRGVDAHAQPEVRSPLLCAACLQIALLRQEVGHQFCFTTAQVCRYQSEGATAHAAASGATHSKTVRGLCPSMHLGTTPWVTGCCTGHTDDDLFFCWRAQGGGGCAPVLAHSGPQNLVAGARGSR